MLTFASLPVVSIIRATTRPKGFLVAKSAVRASGSSGRDLTLYGFSCGLDRELCLRKSRFEVCERFWASYPVLAGMVRRDTPIEGISWPGRSEPVRRPAHAVLLGFSKDEVDVVDATGLAFGTSFEDAVERSVQELCERHVIAEIWYKRRSVMKIDDLDMDQRQITISFYSVPQDRPFPFVLAVLEDEHRNVWLCGSAVDKNFEEARERAMYEAVMLCDALASRDEPRHVNIKSAAHFRSLEGPLASARKWFFKNRVLPSAFRSAKMGLTVPPDELFRTVFGNKARASIVVIHGKGEEWVVRAGWGSAFSPAMFRHRPEFPSLIPDPFC